MELHERVKIVMARNKITAVKLAEVTDISKYTLDKQLQGARTMHVRVLVALAELAPHEDMHWVLTGEMFQNTTLERLGSLEAEVKVLREMYQK